MTRAFSCCLLLTACCLPARGQQIRTPQDYDRAVTEAKARVAAFEAAQKTAPVSDRGDVQAADRELLDRLDRLERELQQYRRDMAPAPNVGPAPGMPPGGGAPRAPVRPPQVGECRQPIPWDRYDQYFQGSPYQPRYDPPPPYPYQPQQPPAQPAPDPRKHLDCPLHAVQPEGAYFVCDPSTQLSLQLNGGNGFCGPGGSCGVGGVCDPSYCPTGYPGGACPTGYCPDPYAANYGSFNGGFSGQFGGSPYGFAPEPRFRSRLSVNIEFERRRRLLFLLALRRRGIRLNINANFDGGWGNGWGGYQPIQPFSMPYAPTWNGGGQFDASFRGGFRGGAGGPGVG